MIKCLIICALALGAVPLSAQEPVAPPRLSILIVVDQMRPDYLDRYGDLFTGGLARLRREGTCFDHAYHDHSCTLTGPGHATLATGTLPAHHGIVGNDFFDRVTGREVYCCSDTGTRIVGHPELKGASPVRLLRPTFAERFKRQYPGARVVSLALKDRAAVLMAGRQADLVLWYEEGPGRFVTSSWYAESVPAWVTDVQPYLASFADSTWTRLLPDSAYARSGPDSAAGEPDGMRAAFPHACNPSGGQPGKAYYDELYCLPFGDQTVLHLARRAVEEMRLGRGSDPDLLLLGCSAADGIGHRYGPDSHEVQDYYVRLDRYLAELFDFLDRAVGQDQWLVALASDHGVMPLPEASVGRGIAARRVPSDTVRTQVRRLATAVSEAWGVSLDVRLVEGGLAFAPEVWQDSARAQKAADDLAERLRSLDWVADVYTRQELSDPTADRPYMSLFRHACNAERSADLFLREREHLLVTSRYQGTTHGSPYPYDTRVPLLFMGPGIDAARRSDSVRTVDLVPTLCDLLGVSKDQTPLDGVSLAPALRR